jgi:hypothetical protein
MRIAKGQVVEGQVVLEGEPLPEGSRVTVFVDEGELGGFASGTQAAGSLLDSERYAATGTQGGSASPVSSRRSW